MSANDRGIHNASCENRTPSVFLYLCIINASLWKIT